MDIGTLNKSQLVTLLRSYGYFVGKQLDRGLLEAAVSEIITQGFTDLVDGHTSSSIRQYVMDEISRNEDFLLRQFGCDGDCLSHPDSQVAICYMALKGELP